MFKRDHRSLKLVFILSYLAVGIIPLLVIGIVSGMIVKQSMYDSQVKAMNQISSTITNNIDRWGEQQIVLVEETASSQVVKSGIKENIQGELAVKVEQDSSIKNMLYVDAKGNVLVNGLGILMESVSDKDYFNETMKGLSFISNVYEEDNRLYIAFTAPIIEQGITTGAIISQVEITKLDDIVGDIFFADKSTVFTFDSNGNITWHTDKQKIGKENLLDDGHSGFREVMDTSLKGIRRTNTIELDGIEQVVVGNFIDVFNWGVATAVPVTEVYAGFRQVLTASAPIAGILVVMIVICALRQRARIANPITKLSALVQEVANGDLTIKADVCGAKELTVIGEAFNEMTASLRTLTEGIYEKNGNLQEAAEGLIKVFKSAEASNNEMVKAMEGISEGAINQEAQVEEVLSGTQDLDAKVDEAKDKLIKINETIAESKVILVKAQGEVGTLKEETEGQRRLVNNTVQEVNGLEEAVGHINTITQTINAIADQTHLLALNASIEAARAGESGRGFAVVATEIGKLAEQSQSATQDIASILSNIKGQTEATKSLMMQIDTAMSEQAKSVEGTYAIFKQVEEADTMIIKEITDFSNTVDYIGEFSKELLEITDSLSQIAEESTQTTGETTAALQEQLSMMESLNQLSENIKENVHELQQSIGHFKIEDK